MKKSIINAINSISTHEELNEVIDLLKAQQRKIRSATAATKRSQFVAGDHVIVTSQKNGRRACIIEKVKRTKAVVSIDAVLWNVPLSLIEAA